MSGLRDQFARFYEPSPELRKSAFREGLVTLDTNVLLSLYRFLPQARSELLGVLEKLDDRLWMPHQVALEFHQRRLSVIGEQEAFFGRVSESLNSTAADYIKKLKEFSNRVVLSSGVLDDLVRKVQDAYDSVDEQIKLAETENPVRVGDHRSDKVLDRLEIILEGRVGDSPPPEKLEEARKEALHRVKERIPPGYMDRGKPDPCGDYLIWDQIKREAASRKVPTIFVTDDKKEDWFWRERGLTLGPRVELFAEMEAEAGVPFILMTTESFLLQAQQYLSAAVSSTTVDQAKDLPRNIEPLTEDEVVDPHESLDLLLEKRRQTQDTIIASARKRDAARSKMLELARSGEEADRDIFEVLSELVRHHDDASAMLREARQRRAEINSQVKRIRRMLSSSSLEPSYWSTEEESLLGSRRKQEQNVPSEYADEEVAAADLLTALRRSVEAAKRGRRTRSDDKLE
jgi:hypothetical protein